MQIRKFVAVMLCCVFYWLKLAVLCICIVYAMRVTAYMKNTTTMQQVRCEMKELRIFFFYLLKTNHWIGIFIVSVYILFDFLTYWRARLYICVC